MPLVRRQVRNEYRLGDSRLYEGKSKKDDSKAILDGIAVAGLVGLLRQLGDLTEFAADVFQDLQEQVTATAARGRKIFRRIQNIEFALPFVEKAVKGQTSHIHFAYVAGSEWHANLQDEKSHLVASELPCFMMEAYEECREPPRLHLLDKFDHDGTGACQKRYSDPSYFRRVWTASELEKPESLQREKKVQKIKRKGSQLRNEEVEHAVYISCKNDSIRFASPSIDGHSITTEDASVHEAGLNSELSSRSPSFGSRIREQALDVNNSVVPSGLEDNEVPDFEVPCDHSSLDTSVFNDNSGDKSKQDPLHGQSVPRSYSITWDEKTEIFEPRSPVSSDVTLVDIVQDSESLQVDSDPQNQNRPKAEAFAQADILLDTGKVPVSLPSENYFDEVTSEADNYMDASNTLESDAETEVECQPKWEVNPLFNFSSQEMQPGTVRIQDSAAPNTSSDLELSNASHSSLNQDTSSMFSILKPSGSSDHMHPPQKTSDSSANQVFPAENKLSENDNSDMKYNEGNDDCLLPESSIADSQIMMAGVNRSRTSVSKHSPLGSTSNTPSIQLWSNGGLFGVEPSKPLFLGVINNSSVDFISGSRNSRSNLPRYILKTQKHINESSTKSDAICLFSKSTSRVSSTAEKHDRNHVVLSSLVQCNSSVNQLPAAAYNFVRSNDSSKSPSCNGNQNIDAKQQSQVPEQPLPSRVCDMGQDNHSICTNVSSIEPGIAKTSDVVRGAPLSAVCNTKSQYHAHSQSTKCISSGFSELAQRFLANSLQRKGSITNTDSSSYSANKRKPEGTSYLNNHNKVPSEVASQAFFEQGIKNQVACESLKKPTSSTLHYSEQSSPPIEEMNISFQPMNGLETLKVKLKVLNGSLPENKVESIFPSFQLLQDPVDPSPHSGSESDDDTFCRSCSYSSQDLLSPHTYSNTELWEKYERSECKDHEFCDDSPEMPLPNTSISGHMEFKQMNHSNMDTASGLGNYGDEDSKVTSQDISTLKVPDLNSTSLGNRQRRHDSSSDDPTNFELQTNGHLPPPPPLPPVKWRITKPSITLGEHEVARISGNTNHLNGLQAPKFFPPRKQEQNGSGPCISEPMIPNLNKKTQDQQKLNEQKNLKHGVNNKEVDLWGELLRQIRNKSYNLRSTTMSQTNLHPQASPRNHCYRFCNLGEGKHNSPGVDTGHK